MSRPEDEADEGTAGAAPGRSPEASASSVSDPPAGSVTDPPATRPPLWLIFSITVTGILANTVINAPLPDILAGLDQPDSQAGLLVAAGSVPGIFMAPVIGVLADRYGRRRVLVPCLASFGAFGLLSAFAPTFGILVALRLAQGFGSAGLINLSVVLITDHWDGLDRARLIGYNAAVLTVSLAVFPALGGALAEIGGWRWSFAPYGIGLVTAALIQVRLPSDRIDTTVSIVGQLRASAEAIRHPVILASVAWGFVFFVMIFGLFLTVMPILLEERFDLDAGWRGLVISVPAIASTTAALSLSKLRSHFGGRRLVLMSSGMFAIAFAVIGWAPAIALLLVGVLFYGFAEGASFPTVQDFVAGAAPEDQRGAAIAVWVGGARAGQTVGPLLAGASLAVFSPQATFLLGAVLAAALFAGQLMVRLERAIVRFEADR